MSRNAFRYLGWMVLDRTGPRLLAPLLIVAAMCVSISLAMGDDRPPPSQIAQIAEGMYFQFACVAVVVLFHGIVAEDRTRGFYRFYLAKPVSPLWFYGQSAFLALVSMLIYTAGFLAIFSFTIGPVWEWKLAVTGAALGLLIGGMMFALSTVTPRDWMWMIVAIGVTSILRHRFPKDASPFGGFLHAILPPNHLTDETSLTTGQWAWLIGWSLGLFALGLLVLRKRPLGED